MRQLTQLEKRLLIILALQKQLQETGAVGDFAKTITSTSNKIKQISETFKEIGRWAGQLMLVFVDPFVDKLLVASLTLKEMLKSLAYAQGYQPPDFAVIKQNSEDTEENTDNILENVEQLEKKLLGFDKLNILGETSSNELSTELDLIANAMGTYNSSFENANKEMKETSENLMRWLGYVQVIETYTTKTGDTIETTVWKLQEGDTRLKNIVSTIVGLGSTLATIGLVKKIDKIAIAIGTSKETGILGAVSKISSTIGGWIAVIAVLVTGFTNLYNKSDDFATSVNKSVDSIIQNFGRFFNIISNIIEKIWNSSAFQSLLDAIGYILKVALDLVDISVAIGSFNWVDLGSKFSQLGNDLWNGVIGNLAHALNSVLTAFIDNVGKPIINFFNEKVGPAIKRIFYTVVGAIVGFFERMINYIVDGINWVLGGVSDVWEFLGGDPIEKVGYVNWTDKFNDKMATSAPIIEAGQLGTQTAISTLDPETQQQWSQQVDQDMANFVGVISQSVAQSVLPLVQAVVSGNADLKEAITELAERPIELNGRKVSESIYDDLKEVQNRKGTSY